MRDPDGRLAGRRGVLYPVSELAQKHGAGVEVETDKPPEAYARFPEWRPERPDDPGLPWR